MSLRKSLQEHVLVSVDERDEADAEKALKDMDELIDISLPSRSDLGKAPAPVVRTMTKIGDMVMLRTIDNFQGVFIF